MSAPEYEVKTFWFAQPREVILPATDVLRMQMLVLWQVRKSGPQSLPVLRDFLVRHELATPGQAAAVERALYTSLRHHAAGQLMDDTFLVRDGLPIQRTITPLGRDVLAEYEASVKAAAERRVAA